MTWSIRFVGMDTHAETVKAGDRIKTDRRDAEKLARSYRAAYPTPVWVRDGEHEAIRDLVRAREAAEEDQLRAKHRFSKYLLRYGEVLTVVALGRPAQLRALVDALQALRGVAKVTAV